MRTKQLAIALALALGLPSSAAWAQKQAQEVDVQRGPAAELYIRKRPSAPEAPVLSADLKTLLASTEKRRDDKRLEAIGLLRSFLGSNPSGEARADGMFKLAELLWEESRRLYLIRMDDYSRALEKCSQKKGECDMPKEPRIQLQEAAALYTELHDKFPKFRRMDLVTYLIGFAAKEDGREDDAMAKFQEVIDRFPQSPLFGDAWMMVGEHWFATSQWQKSIDAYAHIPDSAATSDLATFKTAWCYWKLGQSEQAAKDFKRVLDKAVEAERTGTAAQRRRSAGLRDEALEYLVVVFTEDRSIGAQEVFDFLASIGGERYSRDVMIKVAESYAGQAEWERSNEAYRFLIKMEPGGIKAAEYQREIVQNWTSALDVERAQDEIKVLLDNYGPQTAWAKEQKNRDALARSLETTEQLVRTTATNLHGEAQRREKIARIPKQTGCATTPIGNKDLQTLYTKAADAYDLYLTAFAQSKVSAEKTIELRYYRADILCFKLGKVEPAGDEYLAVGKSAPVGKYHKDALLNAMAAFEAARPKDTVGRRKLYDVDKKFGEAIDLYATLFPADPTLVGVIFKNGQMFYDYGEYDEAIKRFGVIVTKYPKDPNAGPAGDRILSALNKAQDYENIEDWARKLKSAPSFASKDQQDRLSRLIVESIQKSGDKYADAGKYEQAAKFYLRVPKETGDAKVAAQAMMNAGVMYEKAKQPEDAADVYIDLAQKYATSSKDTASKAAFAAGQVYEKAMFYDRAAKSYELVYDKFGSDKNDPKVADSLFNAGVLRQAIGQNDRAIAHYKKYKDQFASRKDAPDVAFNIGVVYQDAGQEGPAYTAFADYTRTYRSSGRRVIEAHTRAGLMSLKLGQLKRAKEDFAAAQALYKHANGKEKAEGKTWAAQARYNEGELIFREYEKVTLDVKPSQLQKALTSKSKLLAEAEKVYGSVVDYEDLKWATAALYRTAQVYDGFAESLINAPTPKGLPQDQADAYRQTLDMYVV
ncbi:MAG TPA: tetratricopeptide repeat protein, partial [Kofleriaceae bacterium]|nr:tetratricopeptide repeat protein [Kofleriaceae bacterium]